MKRLGRAGTEFVLFSDCGVLQFYFNGIGWKRQINCCCGIEACQSLKNCGVCVVLNWSDEVQITGHSCGHKLGLSNLMLKALH